MNISLAKYIVSKGKVKTLAEARLSISIGNVKINGRKIKNPILIIRDSDRVTYCNKDI